MCVCVSRFLHLAATTCSTQEVPGHYKACRGTALVVIYMEIYPRHVA